MSKPVSYLPDGSYNYSASLYGEEPSKTLALSAGGIFTLLFIFHIVQAVQFKTRYLIAAIISAFMEALGYGMRYKSIDDPFNVNGYAGQQGMIILAPVLLAASQYVVLEKIILQIGESASPIRASLIAKIFVACDVLSFAIQGAGSGILVSSVQHYTMGTNILIGGLIIQVISYASFLTTALVVYSRGKKLNDEEEWRRMFQALFTGAILVMIRSVFRVIEFAMGYNGPIATNEKFMYVFDFGLVAGAMLLFNIFHPGKLLRSAPASKITRDVESAQNPPARFVEMESLGPYHQQRPDQERTISNNTIAASEFYKKI
ncbi:hypothetical protein HK100_009503 [Physocladia obscura]|uniref:RTA1-domain-containing protein n=1 Tax=Physocladia obscura TaxID=109957 RepID=A0AAD5T9W5_9FUNG|nr:hypothetical protein HK100_009503 [Physocladia obscura]